MAAIKITVDGCGLETEQGKTVLEACLDGGIYIPHLCGRDELHPIGACRLCVVEINGSIQASCVTQAEDGMEIITKGGEIDETRRFAIELMLSGHQADCGTCVKYLNCELQALKQYLVADELSVRRRSRLFGATESNPVFTHEPNKCVLCGRCVRACRDLRGVGILYYKRNHGETYIGVGPDPERDIPLSEAGCRFCGACAEVCPTGAILDRDEFGRNLLRKEALLPCAGTCPAGIDVPRYIRFIRENNLSAAMAVLREKVPFPRVLGYVCSHPCEGVCRRGQINSPVSICRLKRYAADNEEERSPEQNPAKKADTGKRAAVIGAGPAGLTAAYYLALLGHSVTVFEAMPEPGGMLRYGIPEYRLPLEVLKAELRDITQVGIDIRVNTKIESVEELFDSGFDAVLIAVGTHAGVRLRIPGARGEGVFINTDFLRAVRLGESPDIGRRVMVLGGGSVALDCARTAVRLGAEEVMLACLESMETMPAPEEERGEAAEEGIKIFPSRTFARIVREDGQITGVEFLRVASFSFDEDKRLSVETEDGSEHIIGADTVIFAVGQRPELPAGVDKTDRGLVDADTRTMRTDRDGVFAAGDAVTGTDKVISAIAAGRGAAQAIDKFLGGRGRLNWTLAPDIEPEKRLLQVDGFAEMDRVCPELAPAAERVHNFKAVEHCLNDSEAAFEAGRCLQCDLRLKMKPVKFWSAY